jgi:hypothetical protein
MRLENREACDCASPPESPMDPGVSFGGFSRDFDRAAAAAPIIDWLRVRELQISLNPTAPERCEGAVQIIRGRRSNASVNQGEHDTRSVAPPACRPF